MGQFTFATYNTKDYRRDKEALSRAPLVEQVIREMGVQAIALQEMPGQSPQKAAEDLRRLARATGMAYLMPGRKGEEVRPAFAIGHNELSVALLWNPDVVRPIPGTLRVYEEGLWHALVVGEFDIEGNRVALASSHGPPRAGYEQRTSDAVRVGQLLSGYELVLLGKDRNCVGADYKPDGTYYDPDPYQPDAPLKANGEKPETAYPTDRSPAAALTAAGLMDLAPYVGVPWEPTTGHWPGEANGYRRIDEIRASRPMAERALICQVMRSAVALQASDHLGVKGVFDMAADNRFAMM